MGKPKSNNTLSTCSKGAPSRARRAASNWRANRIRLPTKPGHTPTRIATFLIRLARAIPVLITASEVFSPRTTSSSFITLAGEKKCRPITDSGRLVTEAISLRSSAEVLEARIAPGLAMPSRRVNISFFTAMFSKTASIIRSQSARSPISKVPVTRPQRCSTASAVKRPLRAVFS